MGPAGDEGGHRGGGEHYQATRQDCGAAQHSEVHPSKPGGPPRRGVPTTFSKSNHDPPPPLSLALIGLDPRCIVIVPKHDPGGVVAHLKGLEARSPPWCYRTQLRARGCRYHPNLTSSPTPTPTSTPMPSPFRNPSTGPAL